MKSDATDTKLKLRKASDAPKRAKAIERGVFESLGISEPTELHRVLSRRIADLTIISEELSSRLIAGEPISVEVMGRNADRLQRTMCELRKNAPPRIWNLSKDDDNDEPSPVRRFFGR